ncbi:MAG: hypothetical protein VKJ06_03395 [Vampirovibrionales bacterium]|nr:hypothetical protein [Vampirovibrionales bacterium]
MPTFRQMLSLFFSAFVISAALTVAIVSLWKGLPVLSHGIPTCGVLIQNNLLHTLFYNSCGCATVLIVLNILSIVALQRFFPLFLLQIRALRAKP